jgi:Flp pilus assembly CpaE family ATPase
LDAADQTLFVTTPEAPTLRRSELGLRQLAAWNYPNAKLKVILNRTSLKTGITDNEVAAILSHPVSWTLADEQYALQAATAGVPVVHAYPKSELSRALHVVARQIAGLPEPPQRSWFSLLMRRPALALAQV